VIVDPQAMKVLADVLDDPNPIHLDPRVVARLGMGDRVINQGPANCSYVVNALRDAFPDGTIAELRFRLLGNVYGGDEVTAGHRIVERDDTHAHCTIWLDVHDGRRVVEGTATVAL
jgi:3-hydroxybutyryl-CoA dehydratase